MESTIEAMDVDVSLTADDNAKDLNEDNDEIEVPPSNETLGTRRRYANHGANFTTGFDVFRKEEKSKMETRARRFGLRDTAKKSYDETADSLYLSMGIDRETESAKNTRLNVLHVRGTRDMSTKDVLKYFQAYAPTSVEWINDVSCNVAWPDKISAARALLGLSKKIVGPRDKLTSDGELESKPSTLDDEKRIARDNGIVDVAGEDGSTDRGGVSETDDDNAISSKEVDCPLPPGFWRKGARCSKSKNILLRFATRNDKKQPRAEKMSDYYKKHGNPNFGGIRGLLTESRKRMYKEVFHPKNRRELEPEKARAPPSEEDTRNIRRKNPWGDLSETWGQNDSVEDDFFPRKPITREQTSHIKERLGSRNTEKEEAFLRYVPSDSESSGSGGSGSGSGSSSSGKSDDEWCKRSKGLRMRMHADDEEEKILKKRIKRRRTRRLSLDGAETRCNDLRSRLNGAKKTPVCCEAIRVVVKNTSEKYRSQQPLVYEEEAEEEEEGEEEEERVAGEPTEVQEPEEGEWTEGDAERAEEEIAQDRRGEGDDDDEDEDEDEDEDDSQVSEKEVQGPRGSVIKVVPRAKPRVASTVWARLNGATSASKTNDRSPPKESWSGRQQQQLQQQRSKGDLRSRLGHQNRGRSPLRIEVKNDKYAEESSGTE